MKQTIIGTRSYRSLSFIKRMAAAAAFMLLCIFTVSCSHKEREDYKQFSISDDSMAVVIDIENYGSFELRLYHDEAPALIDSVLDLIDSGSYSGGIVSQTIEDYFFMLEACSDEASARVPAVSAAAVAGGGLLKPFYGAVCIPVDDSGLCDPHRIMIITSDPTNLKSLDELLSNKQLDLATYLSIAYGTELTKEELEEYMTYGGAPWLQGHCIVIGQVYGGYHVLEALGDPVTEPGTYRPIADIHIGDIALK